MSVLTSPARALLDASMRGKYADAVDNVQLEAVVGTRCPVGWTSLHYAAKNNMLSLVSRLLALGVPADIAGDDDTTPLYLAAQEGALQAAEELVSWGACATLGDDRGVTPCLIAAQNGHLSILRLLAPLAGANHAHEDGTTLLQASTRSGHPECISFLVELGADVTVVDHLGVTPLMLAARRGHADAVMALFEGKLERL